MLIVVFLVIITRANAAASRRPWDRATLLAAEMKEAGGGPREGFREV